MPFIIGDNIKNALEVMDPVSGTVITLYYRLPTSEERVAYSVGIWEKEGGKVVNKPGKPRQQAGLEILSGIKDGDFVRKIEGGTKPISSDSASPDYDPDWKELVKKYAIHLIEALAVHVFEGARTISSQMEALEAQKN
jgi:hypothetical protein